MLTRHRALLLVVLLTALLIAPLSAPQPVAAATQPAALELTGAIGGEVKALAVSDTTAYVGEGLALVIVDVRDPAHPARRGQVALPQAPQEIQVIGSLAYVADGAGGLQILDVSNPAAPALRGSFATSGDANGVAVVAGRAYVAVGAQGLQIVDVSSPTAPALLGSYNDVANLCQVNRVEVVGTLAYLAADCGFQIVDVSSPTAPTLLGSYSGEWLRGFQIVANLAYIARGMNDSSLLILDIAAPTAISKVGEVATMRSTRYNYDVAVVGGVAYVSGVDLERDPLSSNSFISTVVDITNPASPFEMRQFQSGYALSIEAGKLYLATGEDLDIFDLSSPSDPSLYAGSELVGSAWRVQVTDNTAYLLNAFGGLRIIDLSNPAAPKLIGAYKPIANRGFYDLYVVDTKVYIVQYNNLLILDVSDPANPVLLSTYTLPGSKGSNAYAFSIFVSAGRAYVGLSSMSSDQLAIIDVSNPSIPTLLGSSFALSYPRAVVVGDLAYVATSSGMSILNVASPTNPAIVGRLDLFGEVSVVFDVQVVGNLAYLAYPRSSKGGLKIVDVQNPAAPVVKATYALPARAKALRVADGVVYITSGDKLWVLDVRNPDVPTELLSYPMPDVIEDVDMIGSFIYVAGDMGLQILREHRDLFPATGTVGPAGGSVANYDGSVSLSFPAGAVSATTSITYTGELAPSQPLGLRLGSLRSFTLTATDGAGAPVTQFAQPYTLVVSYSDAELAAAGLSEASLNLAFWDGSAWANLLPCAGCSVDTLNNTVTVKLSHFTEFALLGAVDYKSYLPLVRR